MSEQDQNEVAQGTVLGPVQGVAIKSTEEIAQEMTQSIGVTPEQPPLSPIETLNVAIEDVKESVLAEVKEVGDIPHAREFSLALASLYDALVETQDKIKHLEAVALDVNEAIQRASKIKKEA